MNIRVGYLSTEVDFPAISPPAWAGKVERWYQLDLFAFALAEAVFRWRDILPRPSRIYLAGEGASNPTDFDFVRTGAASPTRFVHTLPNIRASSMLQVMEWSGELFSLHIDPASIAFTLAEALDHQYRAVAGETWVVHSRRSQSGSAEVNLFRVGFPEGLHWATSLAGDSAGRAANAALLEWFKAEQAPNKLWLAREWAMAKEGK